MSGESASPGMRSHTGRITDIVRDNYRINKFTSWRNAYNISTSAKSYRDTVVYHQGSYSPRSVTHCRAYVVSRYPFGSYPPRCSMVRIVRHARSTPLKNRSCLFGNCQRLRGENVEDKRGSSVVASGRTLWKRNDTCARYYESGSSQNNFFLIDSIIYFASH